MSVLVRTRWSAVLKTKAEKERGLTGTHRVNCTQLGRIGLEVWMGSEDISVHKFCDRRECDLVLEKMTRWLTQVWDRE